MTASYPAIASLGWLSLAFGSALLGEGRRRRVAAGGMASLGLGLAAWRVSSPEGSVAAPDALGDGFLVVNGGLLVLGLALPAWAALRPGFARRDLVSALAVALGVALVGWLCAGLVIAAGSRVVASAGALALAGAVLIRGGRALASTRPAQELARRIFGEPVRPRFAADGRDRWLAAGTAAGAVAVAIGGDLVLVFLGTIAAALGAYLLFHARGARPVPLAPALALLLVPAGWLLRTIAGSVGSSIEALPSIPLSPAAESLVTPALLLAAWGVSGLWPLHRQVPGALLGPVGGLLLLRIGHPLVPGGLEQWQPLAVPVLVVGLWHAAARDRWPLAAAGAGLLGIVALSPAGAVGAAWLFGAGLLLEVSEMRPPSDGPVTRAIRTAAWVAAAWGGLLVLEGGLRSEVVYSVFGAAGLALIIAGGGVRHHPR
jgi:hypothetical protein